MSNNNKPYTLEGGLIKPNYAVLGAVATYDFTVPKGKTWLLLGLHAERDVAATLDVYLKDPSGNIIMVLATIGAAATHVYLPRDVGAQESRMWGTMRAGSQWVINLTWGVAQTTPEVALIVKET